MEKPVSELLRRGGVIVYISPQSTVAEAAERMAEHNVSSILIMAASRRLVGIFTERDLLRRVVVPNRDHHNTLIEEVMTADVIVVSSDTPCSEVRHIMREQHIRHIPVADNDNILGVISLRDVLRHQNLEKDFEITQLKEYVMDKPYPLYPA